MTITTGNHPKELWPGVKATFGASYDEHTLEYKQLFTEETSTKAFEERVQQYGFGLAAEKDQGASITYEDTNQGYVSRISNVTYAIGATVTATCGDQVWTLWAAGGDGLLCSNEQLLDFGVGDAETIDQLEITWPSGMKQEFAGMSASGHLLIVEGDEEAFVRD